MNRVALLAALAAAILIAFLPITAHAGRALLMMKRSGGLDTIGISPPGGLARKEPAHERVSIDKKAVAASAVITRKDPLVMLTEPRSALLDARYQRVSGRVGGGITKAFVRINDDVRIVPVYSGRFSTFAALRPGLNTVTVLAWDLDGNLGKDSMNIFVRQEQGGPSIRITAPRDGTRMDVTRERVVTVKAEVSDKTVTRAVLVVNDVPRIVSVEKGNIDQDTALMPGPNEIYMEVADASGRVGDSRPVSVSAFDSAPKDLVAVLTWDSPDTDMDLHAWDSFGHHTFADSKDPYQCEAAIPYGMLDMDRKGGYGPEVFSLEAAEPEVYTFYVNYNPGLGSHDGADAYLRLLLYGDEPSRRIVREFGPFRLSKNRISWEAAHVKMPEGVFFQEKDEDLKKTLGMDAKAIRRLALMLKEENTAFGLLAISAMGRIKSEDAVPALLDALETGPAEIRRAAAGALWSIRSVDSVPGLIAALNDEDHEVRRAAAGALGDIGDTSAVYPLTGLLAEEGDQLVRVESIRALGRIGDTRATGTLTALAKNSDPRVRAEALKALGNAGEEEPEYDTETAILRALGDETAGVRGAAAYAAGSLKITDAVEGLTDILYFDDDEGARAQAAAALGALGGEGSVPELERASETDFSPRVRFYAKKALEQIGPTTREEDEHREEEWTMPDEEGLIVY